jgi:hypothetical protein
MDAVLGTIAYGLVYIRFGVLLELRHLDITGVIEPENLRADLLAYPAENALTQFDHGYLHRP